MPSPLEVAFEQFLHTLNAAREPSFGDILDLLHTAKFNGAITLHCHNGVPKMAELGKPIRIDLTRRLDKPG